VSRQLQFPPRLCGAQLMVLTSSVASKSQPQIAMYDKAHGVGRALSGRGRTGADAISSGQDHTRRQHRLLTRRGGRRHRRVTSAEYQRSHGGVYGSYSNGGGNEHIGRAGMAMEF
jgi:hypothetical protein